MEARVVIHVEDRVVDSPPGPLAVALARVSDLVPYLRAEIGRPTPRVRVGASPGDGEWLDCAELIGNTSWLDTVIRGSGRSLGTDDPSVAASLFVQNYSYRVLALAVGCLTTSGVLPDSAASLMAVALRSGRPARLAYGDEARHFVIEPRDDPSRALRNSDAIDAAFSYLVERAIDENLRPLVEATRSKIRVGARLLWGNVAASAAVAFRTMEGCLGPFVQGLGTRFFETGPPELQGLGSFLLIEHANNRGWFWERTNCCLYDRLPGGIRCSDCSRTPSEQRRAAYRASLEAAS